MSMKRGTIIECTKDVIMKDGETSFRAFTKGKRYKTYPYKDRYDVGKVTCAKNDQNNRHIIRDGDGESFFRSHFKVVNDQG